VEAVRERTLFTELHESRMLGAADSVVGTGIFSGMPDVAERRDWLAGRAAELERRALEQFDTERMRERYARAVAANPEDPWPDVIASQVFFVSGCKGEAMGFARIAHGKAPNVEDAVLGFCLEAMRAGRVDEAMGYLKELERLWPRDELLPKLYEEILGKGGDMAEAVPHLKRRAERDPRNFKLWNNLAMAQQKAGAPREAAESYRRGLDLQPDDAAMLNNLAWLLATLGGETSKERQEAVGLALRAVELEPGAHRFRGTLAVALMESGRETEGREEAEQAMEMARKAGDEEAVEELGRRFAPRMED
jgi:Tfp pilus assembly protein PilF